MLRRGFQSSSVKPTCTPSERPAAAAASSSAEREAFEGFRTQLGLLVHLYHPRFLRLAFGYLGHRADAEDAVQGAYLRVLRQGVRALPLRPGYVAEAVRNQARDLLRRRACRQAFEAGGRECSRAPVSPEQELSVSRAAEVISGSLDALPPSQSVVLDRLYLEGASIPQVASELGISQACLRQRAHRAREGLRNQLGSRWPEDRD